MRQKYKDIAFKPETLAMIEQADTIVDEYIAAGFVMTVRQLYYQLIARDLFPDERRWTWTGTAWIKDPNGTKNAEPNYKWLTNMVNDAKLAGLIDWEGLEDRMRDFVARTRWSSPKAILKAAADSYHEDLWVGQTIRPFVIVEKDALEGVLRDVCAEMDTPLLAARGYPSGSVLREFAREQLIPVLSSRLVGRQGAIIFHLGDHDPSGLDMTRDLEERIGLFVGSAKKSMRLVRIALNMDQIEELKPPPSPAKTTDARFSGYMEQYGQDSWELDALTPQYLNDLLRTSIESVITNEAEMAAIRSRITTEQTKLRKVAEAWK